MGNDSSFEFLDKVKVSSLEDFQKIDTIRKMTIHMLSNNKKDCISLIEYFTHEKMKESDQLLEKDIKKKINLFSFINYKAYDSVEPMMKEIKELSSTLSRFPKSPKIFSEVIMIINNEKINEQIEEIKNIRYEDEDLLFRPHLNPFIVCLSPNDLNLEGFITSKTFHFRLSLQNILNFSKKNANEVEINKEFTALNRKINILFSYYNELGDKFSFLNSEGTEVSVRIEDDMNITVFINILLLGRSGSGKSTLVNLLLDEKKSIEGGSGLSTTSKNLLVYQKSGVPLRFYDVKGIEDQNTVQNYCDILKGFNAKDNYSKNTLNAIFYCISYKTDGTILEQMEHPLFEYLVEYNIPILFIITNCPHNPAQKGNLFQEKAKEMEKRKYINVIHDMIKSIFTKKNKKIEESDNFINNYIKIFFVNLRRNFSTGNKPFGLDEVLSFFTNSVSKEDWINLEKSCLKNEEENCKTYCKNNPFLKGYSDFDKINLRNKEEAASYLKGLEAGAFFSGWVPGLDLGMEYLYRYKFEQKLKSLYGFDIKKAEQYTKKKENQENKENKENKKVYTDEGVDYEELSTLTDEDWEKRTNNIKLEESIIDDKIDKEVTNKGRNAGAIARGLGEIGGVIVKAIPTAGTVVLETGQVAARAALPALKLVSWVLFPITCIASGAWSCYNVNSDCKKMLKIFDEAFTPLRFDTLNGYIKSFKTAINYLESIGNKIIEDDIKEYGS